MTENQTNPRRPWPPDPRVENTARAIIDGDGGAWDQLLYEDMGKALDLAQHVLAAVAAYDLNHDLKPLANDHPYRDPDLDKVPMAAVLGPLHGHYGHMTMQDGSGYCYCECGYRPDNDVLDLPDYPRSPTAMAEARVAALHKHQDESKPPEVRREVFPDPSHDEPHPATYAEIADILTPAPEVDHVVYAYPNKPLRTIYRHPVRRGHMTCFKAAGETPCCSCGYDPRTDAMAWDQDNRGALIELLVRHQELQVEAQP